MCLTLKFEYLSYIFMQNSFSQGDQYSIKMAVTIKPSWVESVAFKSWWRNPNSCDFWYISAPPSRLVKDEYGNEIGMSMSSSEEVSQTVQHPPQNEFARILTSGGMGLCSLYCFVSLWSIILQGISRWTGTVLLEGGKGGGGWERILSVFNKLGYHRVDFLSLFQ